MENQNEESQRSDKDDEASQLYIKDDKGNFVPAVVEPATEFDEAGPENAKLLLAMQQSLHVGPLPSVETFRQYGEVVADAPERILKMAELEQSAMHEARRTHQRDERHLVSQGQWMGFILMLIALGGGIFLALAGHPVVAGALISPAVITPIMRFYFKGRHDGASSKQEE